MNNLTKPGWTAMEHATKEDFVAVMDYDHEYNEGLVDRLVEQLKLLDEEWTAYPVNRYQHSLQSATRAYNDGADEEIIIAALIHDIGDIVAPFNHGEIAAAIMKPYASEKTCWILKHHCIFQGYYYNHYLGGDRNARNKYRDHPYYEDCRYFCHTYDQNAFDPNYETRPLEFFIPMMRRIFRNDTGHLELAVTAG